MKKSKFSGEQVPCAPPDAVKHMPADDAAHVPALDGLRGVAVLLVIGHHSGFLPQGWIGVDLFFVLSGYLITGVLLATKDDPHYYRNFYARRALRIFPLYYLFVGAMLLNHAISDGDTGGGIWILLFLTNWRMVLANGYEGVPGNMGLLWSLAIEEQFYLIWPMLVWLTTRRALSRICMVVALSALLLRMAIVFPIWNVTPAEASRYVPVSVATVTRVDSLLVGAWLALHPSVARGRDRILLLFCAIAVLALFTWQGGSEPNPWTITVGFTLIAVTSMLLLREALGTGIVARCCESRVLRAVGHRSYCMYLFHQTGIAIVLAFGSSGGLLTFIASTAIAFGMAEITWRTIEAPAMALKRHFPRNDPKPATHAAAGVG